MKQLPKNILVVGIMRYTNNGETVETLKEFFKGIPHIDCTEKDNKQVIVYVVQDNYFIRRFIHKIFCMGSEDKMLDYSFYVYIPNSTEFTAYHTYGQRAYFRRLPKHIKFDADNVKKLKLLESV